MSSFVKAYQFAEDLGKGVHNLNSDTLKIYLSNTAPNQSTSKIKADVAEIATGSGYSGPVAVTNSYAQSGGVGTLAGVSFVITASGGSIGPFRYAILYNDTPTSPNDPIIGWWDRGASITLGDGDSTTIDLSGAPGSEVLLTVT